ncbi:MAG: hypothetical protein EP323_09425 [Gammaproteobacteria bacterium]|nr:MAG: hypothetical protein EP323_09425 [Gammaproteobacteria bacterium]
MSGEDAVEDDDFDVEDDDTEEQEAESIKVMTSESRRRLEDRLEERRLQKMISDYDFDLD